MRPSSHSARLDVSRGAVFAKPASQISKIAIWQGIAFVVATVLERFVAFGYPEHRHTAGATGESVCD